MTVFRLTKVLTLSFLIFIILALVKGVTAQPADGGRSSLFSSAGVGARALSMGGAFVALSDDPTAVYWNPAGLDFIQKKGATFFYSSLNFGTSYNFIAGVWPTLEFGTVGIGWARIVTDGVQARDSQANPIGAPGDFSTDQIIFSYAKQLRKRTDSLSVGVSFKIEKLNFSFSNLSDTGVGFDFALLYKPGFSSGFLRNISLGVNIQNALTSKVRLRTASESSPVNFKVGLAKTFTIGENRSRFRLLFDLNQTENGVGTYHIGTEYAFQDRANLRMGFNSGQIALGAGASYHNIRIDYNFGKFFDGADFASNHRFSVTIAFGKGKTRRRRELEAARRQEIHLAIAQELWMKKKIEFNTHIASGKRQFRNVDYQEAYVQFKSARSVADTLEVMSSGYDRDHTGEDRVQIATAAQDTARTWIERTDRKWKEQRDEEKKRLYREERQRVEEAAIRKLNDLIVEHREKGDGFFKNGDYAEAINEWQLVVNAITESTVQNLPENFANIKRQVNKDLATARKYLAAERQERERRVRRLSFDDHFNRGLRDYASKDWERAAAAFKKALDINRNHADARKWYDKAYARSRATVKQMPQQLRAKYARSVALYRQGKYAESLDLLMEIRDDKRYKEQRYNKRILDRIDLVEEKIAQKKRRNQ